MFSTNQVIPQKRFFKKKPNQVIFVSEQKTGYHIDLICEHKRETKLIIMHVIT